MSVRDWRSYAQIAGIVVSVVAVSFSWRLYEAQVTNAVAALKPFQGNAYTPPHCDSPKGHDEADECAQFRMAVAAERMIWLTFGQVAIAIGGLIGLLTSLALTRRALEEARSGSSSAELMAKAMIDMELPALSIRTIGVELEMADRLMARGEAYLAVANDGPPTEFSLMDHFPFRNFGRTVAFPVSLSLGHAITNALAAQPVYDDTTDIGGDEIIRCEPQAEAFVVKPYYQFQLDAEELVAAENHPLWVYGCLTYRDFMNKTREYRFCCRYADRDPDGPHHFACDGDPPEAYTRCS